MKKAEKPKEQKTFETAIPFTGFYHSEHSQALEYVLEWEFENRGYVFDNLDEMFCSMQQALGWQQIEKEYCELYADCFGELYEIESLKFVEMTSPREYNFETDRIFCTISESDLSKIWKLTDKKILQKLIESKFTSYDGFMSFYSNDITDWFLKGLYKFDINEIRTVIEAYILSEFVNHVNSELYNVMDDQHENIEAIVLHDGDLIDRYFKVGDYLQKRYERNLKQKDLL